MDAISAGHAPHSAVTQRRDSNVESHRHHGDGSRIHEGKSHETKTHDANKNVAKDQHRGARVFNQEANRQFNSHFRSAGDHRKGHHSYGHDNRTADGVARNVLSIATHIAKQESGDVKHTVDKIRDDVRSAAISAKLVVNSDAERTEISATLKLVEKGLTALPGSLESAPGEISSATVRAGSTIKIRTQEGDILKLNLRTIQNLSTADPAVEGDAETPDASVALSGQSRLQLEIYGDLNESELAAISEVFEQAANIAEALFSGDLAAAFGSAAQFNIDSSQLATVGLSIRVKASATYALPQPLPPVEPPVETDVPEETAGNGAAQGAETVANDGAPAAVAAPVIEPESAAADSVEESASVPVDDSVSAGSTINTVQDLVAAIQAYFDSLVEGLEDLQVDSSSSSEGGFRLIAAFKLEVLRSALVEAAPEESATLAENVAAAVEDAVVGETT